MLQSGDALPELTVLGLDGQPVALRAVHRGPWVGVLLRHLA